MNIIQSTKTALHLPTLLVSGPFSLLVTAQR